MQSNKSVVFLYTELAGYIQTCLEKLAETGTAVSCFVYPVNPEAPFDFSTESKVRYFNRKDFTTDELLEAVLALQPDVVVCSGWIDKGYLNVCKSLSAKAATVVALDNLPPRSIKGYLSLFRAKLFYRALFDYAWVPGRPQQTYALKMGFSLHEIYTGFYTADFERFSNIEWEQKAKFPKRLVFVGRYVEFKGVRELWNAYLNKADGAWQLYCAGQGSLFEKRTQGEGIHHLGFVQPSELDKFVAQGGIFVLPSYKEPWGVVVHEFASAGYPLICSKQVGAASSFLEQEENGFTVQARSVASLEKAFEKIMGLSDAELFAFGKKSKELASQVHIGQWLDTINKIIAKNG